MKRLSSLKSVKILSGISWSSYQGPATFKMVMLGSSSQPRTTYFAVPLCLMEISRPTIVMVPVVTSLSFLPFLTSKKSLVYLPF